MQNLFDYKPTHLYSNWQRIGIDLNDECKLFKPYTKIKSAKKLNEEGSGLGLYVCRLLRTELNGNIFFNQHLNYGKTGFSVETIEKIVVAAITRKEIKRLEISKATHSKPKIIFYEDSPH